MPSPSLDIDGLWRPFSYREVREKSVQITESDHLSPRALAGDSREALDRPGTGPGNLLTLYLEVLPEERPVLVVFVERPL